MKWSNYTTDCSAVMPISENNTPDFRLIVVNLAELEGVSHLQPGFLSATERHQYDRYRFPKRRLEWLGGRLACKEAVAQLCERVALQDIVVANTEQGSPFVTGLGNRQVQVSISHSGGFAMALASVAFCGLDFQEITPSLARVEEKFVRADEQELLGVFLHSDSEQLGLVWAIKEALRKQVSLWPLLGFLETRLATIDVTEGYFMVQCVVMEHERSLPQQLPVVYATMYKEHALALCFEPEKYAKDR